MIIRKKAAFVLALCICVSGISLNKAWALNEEGNPAVSSEEETIKQEDSNQEDSNQGDFNQEDSNQEEVSREEDAPKIQEEPKVQDEKEQVTETDTVKVGTVLKQSQIVWEKDPESGSYRLYLSDGTKITSENGIIEIQYQDGQIRYYAFSAAGLMCTGLQTVGGSQYYFVQESEVDSSQAGEVSPETSALGSMVIDGWQKVQEKGDIYWYYLGSDGVRNTEKTGKQTINGNTCYLSKTGKAYAGDLYKINGIWYAFDSEGYMVKNDFYTYSKTGKSYYFGSDGKKFTGSGWNKINGSWYYFEKSSSNARVIKKGFQKIKDGSKTYTFFFTNTGVMKKSQWYKTAGKCWYYFDSKGRMLTGKQAIADEQGQTSYYYFRESKEGSYPVGTAVFGWRRIGNFWHYFNKTTGKAAVGPGIVKIGKYKYYFSKTGKAGGGLKTIDGQQYYFQPQSDTQRPYLLIGRWIKKNNRWYYATNTGTLATGWYKISKYWYYFGSDHVMEKSKAKVKGSKKGYLDDNGRWITNSWIRINGNWKYMKSSSGFVTGWNTIGKYKYYFTSDGYLSQDLRNLFTGRKASRYKIYVNREQCVVTVFTNEKEGGEFNIPVVSFLCSVGQQGNGLTPTGTYQCKRADRWQLLMGPSYGQYGTFVTQKAVDIYFHSVAGEYPNRHSLPAAEFNRLGTPASHGCIRLCVSDARWIWLNCSGATVTIYDSSSLISKFDRPTLPKISLDQVTDPTDPALPGTTPSPHKNAI